MTRFLCSILMISILPAVTVLAGARHFGFIYEAPTSAAGSFESENSMTWERGSNPERSDELAFRHEIEIGITDHFQASIYFADWAYSSDGHESSVKYQSAAVELIYNLTSPVLDPVGISVYQEYRGGDQIFEWESKLIAQKNYGPFIFAYNVTLEATWEGKGLTEHEGEFSQAIGASYELSPRWSVGVELLHEFVFPEWHDDEKLRNVFIGPDVSYRHGNWFVTVTALAQATNTPDEADFQVRTIVGIGL